MRSVSARERSERSTYELSMWGRAGTHFREQVVIDFSPVKALELTDPTQHLRTYSIVPTFNNDERFYSQAFMTPYDGLQEDCKMWSQHETKMREHSTEIEAQEILFPKPRHQSMMCFVCLDYYTDYLEHITSKKHMAALKRDKYQALIREAAEQFQEEQEGEEKGQAPRRRAGKRRVRKQPRRNCREG